MLARVSLGDQDAFGHFYDATADTVFGMALSVTGDRTHAEAVTREVYVDVWRTAPGFDATRRAPAAWLAALAGQRIRSLSKLSEPSHIR